MGTVTTTEAIATATHTGTVPLPGQTGQIEHHVNAQLGIVVDADEVAASFDDAKLPVGPILIRPATVHFEICLADKIVVHHRIHEPGDRVDDRIEKRLLPYPRCNTVTGSGSSS